MRKRDLTVLIETTKRYRLHLYILTNITIILFESSSTKTQYNFQNNRNKNRFWVGGIQMFKNHLSVFYNSKLVMNINIVTYRYRSILLLITCFMVNFRVFEFQVYHFSMNVMIEKEGLSFDLRRKNEIKKRKKEDN